jgi:transcriptional regulator with XRE-family HTH domain
VALAFGGRLIRAEQPSLHQAIRKARGLNKSALARQAGVHHSYVVKLEQGRFERPSIDYIARIAAVLGVRVVDLTMDIPIATTNGALRAELAPLGYEDDEMELVVDIVNQGARYSVPMRRRLLLMIQMLVSPALVITTKPYHWVWGHGRPLLRGRPAHAISTPGARIGFSKVAARVSLISLTPTQLVSGP